MWRSTQTTSSPTLSPSSLLDQERDSSEDGNKKSKQYEVEKRLLNTYTHSKKKVDNDVDQDLSAVATVETRHSVHNSHGGTDADNDDDQDLSVDAVTTAEAPHTEEARRSTVNVTDNDKDRDLYEVGTVETPLSNRNSLHPCTQIFVKISGI